MTIDVDFLTEIAPLAEIFSRRADTYDRTATFPSENFDDLVAAGMHAPTVPLAYGGLGLGPYQGDAHTLWMMTTYPGSQRIGQPGDYLREGLQNAFVPQHLALDTVEHCVRACGARCLVRPSPVERIFRDLSFYVRHDNDDHILATIGRAALDQPHDTAFHQP